MCPTFYLLQFIRNSLTQSRLIYVGFQPLRLLLLLLLKDLLQLGQLWWHGCDSHLALLSSAPAVSSSFPFLLGVSYLEGKKIELQRREGTFSNIHSYEGRVGAWIQISLSFLKCCLWVQSLLRSFAQLPSQLMPLSFFSLLIFTLRSLDQITGSCSSLQTYVIKITFESL